VTVEDSLKVRKALSMPKKPIPVEMLIDLKRRLGIVNLTGGGSVGIIAA
jgi:hypothetical protein